MTWDCIHCYNERLAEVQAFQKFFTSSRMCFSSSFTVSVGWSLKLFYTTILCTSTYGFGSVFTVQYSSPWIIYSMSRRTAWRYGRVLSHGWNTDSHRVHGIGCCTSAVWSHYVCSIKSIVMESDYQTCIWDGWFNKDCVQLAVCQQHIVLVCSLVLQDPQFRDCVFIVTAWCV